MSAIINIPGDQPSIQAGLNAAADGDTVLVSPGTYFENIVLDNKNVFLTSNFMFEQNPDFIFSTILNGSLPSNIDTASVIRLIGFGVDTPTVVQGFTITKGTGTNWVDEHGAGLFREGGGILCQYSSPTIRFNLITDNECIQTGGGLVSSGGGAIRSGDGNPRILNNMILNNRGRYGAGIVINFGLGIIKNNVIAFNTGGDSYAGSGIWKNGGALTAVIENNTITGNESILAGGGILIWSTSATLRNNIVWGNIAPTNPQIRTIGGATITVNNCDVQGGYIGTDNIDLDPLLFGPYLYLRNSSPCIDVGDTATALHDYENPSNLGFALWPSFNTLRNDIGAYGGPGAFSFQLAAVFADSTIGWAPLTVNFEGYTGINSTSWNWAFGDDSSASGQTPAHTYLLGGSYDVAVVVDTGSDVISSTFSQLITVLADTLRPVDAAGSRGDTIEVNIYARNFTPIEQFLVPFEMPGTLDLEYLDFTTVGCQTDYFETQEHQVFDPANGRFLVKLETTSSPLSVGAGAVLKFKLIVPETAVDGQTATIEVDGFDAYTPLFSGPIAAYEPVVGMATISVTPCCVGLRGDVNSDGTNANILDLNFLVNRIFRGGVAPGCPKEADVNSDGASGNILDLNFLVNRIFRGGAAPGACI